MAKTKVKGSPNVEEAEVSGLAEAKRGTDQGAGKKKTLAGGIPSLESKNPNPYPNKKSLKNDRRGDVDITLLTDDKALKEYESD